MKIIITLLYLLKTPILFIFHIPAPETNFISFFTKNNIKFLMNKWQYSKPFLENQR